MTYITFTIKTGAFCTKICDLFDLFHKPDFDYDYQTDVGTGGENDELDLYQCCQQVMMTIGHDDRDWL